MPHVIFKTPKNSPSVIAGQTPDTSIANVSRITELVTSEKTTHITGGNNWRTGHTQNHHVEFIDKSDLGDSIIQRNDG